MKHLIIYAHPNPDSFNHAILEATIEQLTALGAVVNVRDLYKLNFNPVLSLEDFRSKETGVVLPDVKVEQDFINEADKITFISPIWWGLFPAMLKGYFDRVFTKDFAYAMIDHNYTGLLGEKKFGMFNTLDATKEDMIRTGMSVAFNHIINDGIFGFCNSPLCFHRIFYAINSVGDQERLQMLSEVKKEVEKFVLDPTYCPFFG
ncbi:MAG: NAD(P)H-dependent oxidoreductase [Bacteroidales bacterium]